MIWSKHEVEIEKMVQMLTNDMMWEQLNEMEVGKVAALKMLRDIRDSIQGIESDVQTAIIGLKIYEKLADIRKIIDTRWEQMTG